MANKTSKILVNASSLSAWSDVKPGTPVDVQEQSTFSPLLAAMVAGFRFFGVKKDLVHLGQTEETATAFMHTFFEGRVTYVG